MNTAVFMSLFFFKRFSYLLVVYKLNVYYVEYIIIVKLPVFYVILRAKSGCVAGDY